MEKARIGYAREMARKVLKDCGITQLPVDLNRIFGKKGYEYIEVDNFLDTVDALYLEKDGICYFAVNSKHHVHRIRFSVAHELGHILMNHSLDYYKFDISLDTPPTEKMHTVAESAFETEANTFAGELLVPLELLKTEFKKTREIGPLAKTFLVSQQVMSIAISNHMSSLFK